MRALGYFTFDPDAQPGAPDRLQTLSSAFEAYCVEKGHLPHGIFPEEGGSAFRPRWAEMVRQVETSGLGYLVVVPSAAHLGDALEAQVGRVLDLDELSCQVICLGEIPDPLQNAMRNMNGPQGGTTRSERIREGMRAKAAKGLGLGKPPFGYKVTVDGTVVPVEEEAEVVREMFELYISRDGGVRTIAKDLNDRGVRTRRGQRWSMVTVRDILRNSAYIGTYRRFGLRIPGTYQPIVTTDEYRQVQERMQSRSPERRHPKSEPFALSGILYCGHCGNHMMGVVRRQTWRRKDGARAGQEYRYYQCQSRINRSTCQYRTTRADDLEQAVLDRIKTGNEQTADAPDSGDHVDLEWIQADKTKAEGRLRALRRRYVEIVQRASTGNLNMLQMRGALAEIEAERHAIDVRSQLTSGDASGIRDLMEQNREKVNFLWDDMDGSERQEALRTLVSRVTFKDGDIEIVPRG
ncbi:MAG: recombinase family protein [Dehalococcoidia bacterium]